MGTAGVTIALLSIFACIVHRAAGANPCIAESFDQSSVVCVCNSTYCDTVDPLVLPPKGKYVKYESSKAGKRLERSEGTLQAQSPVQGLSLIPELLGLVLKLNPAKLYQKIKGFGGAVTDSASINILSLSDKTQDNLLNSYFSENGPPRGEDRPLSTGTRRHPLPGIGYNIIRVPMASCDFSTHVYTYCDSEDDFELKNFSLQDEDLNLKIPVIQRAIAISQNLISLFASPWGPPHWLKTNDAVTGGGTLKGTAGDKYHKTWANYFIRFLDEYKKHQLTFWAVTAQNEPTAGFVPNYPWQCLGFTPMQQRDFIAKDLGPAFANSVHSAVKLITVDDRRQLFPAWPIAVLSDPLAAKYIHGFGVHWYQEGATPASVSLGATHELYPDYFLLATEACHEAGPLPNAKAVQLGNWERGNAYSHSIIEDLTNFVTGWVDWNLALDMQGGPNWAKNYVDSPVIVVPAKDVFYKQPMFYHMGHFSKFIPEGSQRVDMDFSPLSLLEAVAFLRPDGATAVVVLNNSPENKHQTHELLEIPMSGVALPKIWKPGPEFPNQIYRGKGFLAAPAEFNSYWIPSWSFFPSGPEGCNSPLDPSSGSSPENKHQTHELLEIPMSGVALPKIWKPGPEFPNQIYRGKGFLAAPAEFNSYWIPSWSFFPSGPEGCNSPLDPSSGRTPLDVPFTISDPQLGSINTVSPADTIQTYLWNRQ